MATIICENIPDEASKILIIGCGFSRMSEELSDEGFSDITSIDISYNAIKLNQEEYGDSYPNL